MVGEEGDWSPPSSHTDSPPDQSYYLLANGNFDAWATTTFNIPSVPSVGDISSISIYHTDGSWFGDHKWMCSQVIVSDDKIPGWQWVCDGGLMQADGAYDYDCTKTAAR